jgi:hypothetical protein
VRHWWICIVLLSCHAAESEIPAEPSSPKPAPVVGEPPPKVVDAGVPASPKATAAKPEAEPEPERWGEMSVPKPRPSTEIEPPTPEEFAAWDRKDPAASKHLHAWDTAHLDTMLGYWEDMVCFRTDVIAHGEKGFGAKPGSEAEETWFQYKRDFIPKVDAWQTRLFADNPRILENSKLVGHFLEGHELLMSSYPRAFNGDDPSEVAKVDLVWQRVEQKVSKYVESLGGTWPDHEADAAAVQAHADHCNALRAK